MLQLSTRYVRKNGFLRFMAKRRIIVGDEKKPVDKAGPHRLAGLEVFRFLLFVRSLNVTWFSNSQGDVEALCTASGWTVAILARGGDGLL